MPSPHRLFSSRAVVEGSSTSSGLKNPSINGWFDIRNSRTNRTALSSRHWQRLGGGRKRRFEARPCSVRSRGAPVWREGAIAAADFSAIALSLLRQRVHVAMNSVSYELVTSPYFSSRRRSCQALARRNDNQHGAICRPVRVSRFSWEKCALRPLFPEPQRRDCRPDHRYPA